MLEVEAVRVVVGKDGTVEGVGGVVLVLTRGGREERIVLVPADGRPRGRWVPADEAILD